MLADEIAAPRSAARAGTFGPGTEAAKAEEFGGSLPPADRLEFLKEMANALDASFDEIEKQRLFRVLDAHQMRHLADAGVFRLPDKPQHRR
jgi:hypothetical protein